MNEVLLVEDEPELGASIAEYLLISGISCRHVSTAESALIALAEGTPAVLLLDINLPGMSGLELCTHVREHTDAPIVFLSARQAEADQVLALSMGGDDYIVKPFSLAVLAAKVRRLLARREKAGGAGYEDGYLRVDPASGRVHVNGTEVPLKAMEFRLLAYLVVRTTVPEPSNAKVPDLLKRDFTAQGPNQRYVGDITYLPIADGTNLYLATVIDCYSRRLVGWAIADHMRTDLVTDALKAAAAARGSLAGAIFHSDHGSVYTSKDYATLCKNLGVTQSMGAIGSSADNALAESFNAALKREVLQDVACWTDELTCRRQTFRWLTRYNTKRRHSWCRYQPPTAYETAYTATLATAA